MSKYESSTIIGNQDTQMLQFRGDFVEIIAKSCQRGEAKIPQNGPLGS